MEKENKNKNKTQLYFLEGFRKIEKGETIDKKNFTYFAGINININLNHHEEVLDSFNAASRWIQPDNMGTGKREDYPYLHGRDGFDLQNSTEWQIVPSLFG